MIKKSLVCCQFAFLAVGLTALGYCAVVVSERELYQYWAQRQVRDGKLAKLTKPPFPQPPATDAVRLQQAPSVPRASADKSVVGRLEIPHIGVSAMIAEGTSAHVLRRAVGHLSSTALPGQDGNVVVAGHRDTFFRHLGDLKPGDVIEIATSQGQYVYRVRFTDIINPSETWVLQPCTGQTLTLVTCYPFYYVGSAPKRFVVRASRVTDPSG